MFKTLKIVCFFLMSFTSFSQDSEFKMYDNGLIYSDFTIKKLKKCVDSLELKYKSCQPQSFYSVKQSVVNYVILEKVNVNEAKKDLDSGISYADFIKKYPKAETVNELPVCAFLDEDYNNPKRKYINVVSLEMGKFDNYSIDMELETFNKELKGKWIYEYSKKTSYSEESIRAFFFIENFSSNKIADKYAKLIQYSECLIDTTSGVFYENSKNSGIRYRDTIPNKITKFNDYLSNQLKIPSFDVKKMEILYGYDENKGEKRNKKEQAERDKLKKQIKAEFEVIRKKIIDWESKRLTRIDSLKNADKNFMILLKEGYEDGVKNVSSDDSFEEIVGIYISKEAALELKRNRRVIGGCSMDESPRIHAKNIAILSAETAKWEVFLKSHLNIMNDRFDRVSDGSYAYGARNTYIKELEVLDINVPDLILGTVFRIDNPAENHYFASIGRIGRALSESKDRKSLEARMLEYIEDKELDSYNRIMMYYLFLNYNSYLQDDTEKKVNSDRIAKAVATMPDYILSKLSSQ